MTVDKDEVAIVGSIIGFCLLLIGGGRVYEKIESKIDAVRGRVEDLEAKPQSVILSHCEERRAGCGRENKLQFDSGERQFQELKKLIADNDRASNERHSEIMKILMEMNKHG